MLPEANHPQPTTGHGRLPLLHRMSNRQRREPDRALARAFVRNARAFHEMGQAAGGWSGCSSAYYLAIAIELGLKAYLLHRGFSDDWTRVWLRHDLSKALRCVKILGFEAAPEGIAELSAVLGPLYGSGALRSGIQPSLPLVPELVNQTVCDLLSAVEAAIGIAIGTDQ